MEQMATKMHDSDHSLAQRDLHLQSLSAWSLSFEIFLLDLRDLELDEP